MSALGGRQVLVLPEGTRRLIGRDAQRMNILAARVIGEAVRTTLGPRGMDKMLVDSLGDVVITNDGVTILKEMEVEHPAAKMMVEVAKTQDEQVGDGTTTAVVIAGELLHEAERLLDQSIHPTVIAGGYRLAAEKAQQILESIAEPLKISDDEILKKIAMTAMTGKKAEGSREKLAELVVKAVKQIVDKTDSGYIADIDYIGVEKKPGGSTADSQLIQGVILDKERVHPGMPKRVKNAKIALLDCALEIEKTETDAEIRITSPEQLKAFMNEEESILKNMVDKIVATGANVVICQKGIDDLAQHYLAKAGIYAVRRAKKSDMEKLARATGGKVVTNLDDLTANDLGKASLVEERKIGDDKMTFVEGCKDPKAVSLLIRGGTEHVVDEVERAIHDALCVVGAAIEDGKYVVGGGAPEVELAKRLREYSETVGGREALAINAFANAVESIPRTLAENAGLDSIDILVELRAKHEKPEGKYFGVDAYKGKVVDMYQEGVLEPLRSKTQAIKSASEAAIMILRIDDVIAAAKREVSPPKGPSEEEREESSED
ncbi:MAG: thermosome subunit [Candidatus Hadarchaeum yellowstonense]|uniref:Thermosome subunit n=1 Tax=Hadarchaeum yellowstonense TaxID=1776334 RepID=A0A147K1B0_HADYE|nr:MAG: thermosome subunit [Candidatus Hadarchaeum yellowstonense]